MVVFSSVSRNLHDRSTLKQLVLTREIIRSIFPRRSNARLCVIQLDLKCCGLQDQKGLPLLNPLLDLKRHSVQFSGSFKGQSVERSQLKNSMGSFMPIRMMRRREDIVQAALTILDRDGFEAAKMVDIAREPQMVKGTLCLYFDTKVDLLEAVILIEVMPTLQKMGEVVQSSTGPAKDLLAEQLRFATRRMVSQEMATLLRYMIAGGSQHQRIIKLYGDNVVQLGDTYPVPISWRSFFICFHNVIRRTRHAYLCNFRTNHGAKSHHL